MGGEIEKGEVEEVDPQEFVEIRNRMPENKKRYLTPYTPEELQKKGVMTFLTRNRKAGAGLTPEGEIINVFSFEKGEGQKAVIHAIEQGGFKLDALDKGAGEKTGLPDYYKKFGFREFDRKDNLVKRRT